MKILWISHVLPFFPPAGGVIQRSYNLIERLSRKNKLYLFAFNQKAWLSSKIEIRKAIEVMNYFCREIRIFELLSDKSRIFRIYTVMKGFFSKYGYTINWTKSKLLDFEIKRFLSLENIDLIHCDTIGLAEYVKYYFNIKKALDHHNIESCMMLRRAKREKNPLKKFYFYLEGLKLQRYEAKVCHMFDINLVVSKADRKRLLKIAPNAKVEIIPNGVDTKYFKPEKSKHIPHTLLFTGTLNFYPNEDAVLYFFYNIWPLLKKIYPDLTFIIAGKSPTLRIKEITKRDPNIKLTGYVEDIRPYMEQAEVYICPIRDGGGTKLKLLEAMAMKKAIVTTSIGAEGLDVVNNKHLLIADNPKDFAIKVLLVLNNPELRKQLGENARKLVEERYCWDIIGEKLNQIYEELCAGYVE